MTEMAWDHHQRYAFMSELDRVRVPQLVRREASSHSGGGRGVAKLSARGRDRPAPTARGTGDDAEQGADWQLEPGGQPWLQLLPGPVIHADLPPAAALAAPDQHGAPTRVEVGFGEGERLADPQPGAPQHDDQTTQTLAMLTLAGGAQERGDLLHARRVGRIANPLCFAVPGRRGTLARWRATGDDRRHRARTRA